MGDNHSISGCLFSSQSNSTSSETYVDNGSDIEAMSAQGTKSTSGDSYVFTDTESSTDNFVLNKVVLNAMNGSGTDSTSMTTSMSGDTGPGGFSFTSLSENINHITDNGSVTYSGVVTPYALVQSATAELEISVTGPPAATTTLISINTATTTGTADGANYGEYAFAGQGPTAGSPVAGLVGSSPTASAQHLGTSPNSLDTSSGLLSALGGADVHAMSFAGSEILPAENAGGTGVSLEESFESGSEPTNWVSHPSGIGYRRNSPGITTWTGSGSGSTSSTGTPFAGNAPTMDSGMSDGASGEELTRLLTFLTGGNENPSSTQPGPTSRAMQIAGLGNPAVVLCGDGLPANESNVMNDQGPGIWTPEGNPLYGGGFGAGAGTGTGAASHSGPSGSEQSGRTGQQGQGAAGRGYPASTGVPYEDSEGPDSPSPDPYELLYGIKPENKSPDPAPGSQVPAPQPLSAPQPPNKAAPQAPPAAALGPAEVPLGPGDLVIITGNSPVTQKPPPSARSL